MRRDYFGASFSNLDGGATNPRKPTLSIAFTGPQEKFTGWHNRADGRPVPADEVDVTFRLKRALSAADTDGVLGVANRTTGEFILEVNANTREVLRFIRAARRFGNRHDGEHNYTLTIDDSTDRVELAKATFLVYGHTGDLLHQHSLIPSGVEL